MIGTHQYDQDWEMFLPDKDKVENSKNESQDTVGVVE